MKRFEGENKEVTTIFDYDDYITALKDYLDGQGSKPDPHCYFVFGQEVAMADIDSNVLIVVTVASQRALEDLSKAESQVGTLRTLSH